MTELTKKSSFAHSMVAVLWAFLGIRKSDGQKEDMASLSFHHIIIAAVIGVLLFMGILITIVKLVLLK